MSAAAGRDEHDACDRPASERLANASHDHEPRCRSASPRQCSARYPPRVKRVTIEDYERDGFLVVPNFMDVATCERLVDRARRLVDEFAPPEKRSIFTTHEQTRTSDEY